MHVHKGQFFNPRITKSKRSLWHVLLWLLGYYKEDVEVAEVVDFCFHQNKKVPLPGEPSVRWIGHSTFLVQAGDITLLTDPVWAKRASPFSTIGPKRLVEPAMPFSDLPLIDIVLISHNHYDHLDETTVKALFKRYPNVVFYIPLGLKKWFLRRGINRLVELDWWQLGKIFVSPGKELQITSVPAQHFSGRGFFDRDKSLWCGWMVDFLVEGSLFRRCYFAGDTGYNSVDFREIGKRFCPIHLSLLPIGAYRPTAFMSPVHVSPKDAVKIHQEVGSIQSIAGHFGTFQLSDEPPTQPPYDLFLALKEASVDVNTFLTISPGSAAAW